MKTTFRCPGTIALWRESDGGRAHKYLLTDPLDGGVKMSAKKIALPLIFVRDLAGQWQCYVIITGTGTGLLSVEISSSSKG